ncbi:MAG: helix-turn-helix transcriptional regulator [Ekhidna sp.]|nr:helix-turn-helix transcriptional regulator [Ekhidna sp.]
MHYRKSDSREIEQPTSFGRGALYEATASGLQVNPELSFAGYKKGEIHTVDDFYELMHFADLPVLLQSLNKVFDFVRSHPKQTLETTMFHTEVAYRVKGRGGKYYCYLRKSEVLKIGEDCSILRTNAFIEDVSWLKPTNLGKFRVVGLDTSFYNRDIEEISVFKDVISKREAQILKFLARGFDSNDIASALSISRHTVNTHRKNMRRKLEVANTPELVLIARDMGVVD